MNNGSIYRTIISCFISLNMYAGPKIEKKHWPIIQSINKVITLAEAGPRSYNLYICDKSGLPLYLLECYLSAYDYDIEDWDFSGNLECKLTPLYEPQSSRYFGRLLTYTKTPTRDWESRGRFFVEDIQNPLNENNGWGKRRIFRLRNMKLTLKINSLSLAAKSQRPIWAQDDDNRIEKLELEIIVNPDLSANSTVDVVAPITDPKRAISKPRVGK